MKFLDQKEQVIDLQLTQYGKALLSVGAFKPVYYAFGDDDVLYDSDYTSASYGENQSDIESRIQEETPRLSVQANYVSAEKWSKELTLVPLVSEPPPPPRALPPGVAGDALSPGDVVRPGFVSPDSVVYDPREIDVRSVKQDPNKHTPIKFKLGTSAPTSDKLPAWSVSFLNGELSGSTYFYTDTKEELHHIPQLEATIEYDVKTKIVTQDMLSELDGLDDIRRHADRSYIDIQEDQILLRILEENVTFSKENYDIEVYEILNDGEELRPLTIASELMQDDDFLFSGPSFSEDPNDAEHYVELLVDQEIDPELLIDVISKKVGNFYLDKDLKRIQARLGRSTPSRQDIYKSELESVEPCEE